jgi:hypothetical protein
VVNNFNSVPCEPRPLNTATLSPPLCAISPKEFLFLSAAGCTKADRHWHREKKNSFPLCNIFLKKTTTSNVPSNYIELKRKNNKTKHHKFLPPDLHYRSFSLSSQTWLSRRPVSQQFKAYNCWVTDSQGPLTVFHLQALPKTNIGEKKNKGLPFPRLPTSTHPSQPCQQIRLIHTNTKVTILCVSPMSRYKISNVFLSLHLTTNISLQSPPHTPSMGPIYPSDSYVARSVGLHTSSIQWRGQ